MSVATTHRPDPAQTIAGDHIAYGAIHLDVTDRERSLEFWSGLIGLQPLSESPGAIHLGVEDRTLLVLHPGAAAPTPRGHSGLYHLALHLPSEQEFARVLLRIAQNGYPQAPTDHIMHWATYLSDPDGIGLELSFETLDRFDRYERTAGRPVIIDSEGHVRNPTDHLNLGEVVAYLPDRDLTRPLPARTRVGHIHLHVSEIDQALQFYGHGVGFIPNLQEPLLGMADMHAGGAFPHRLAMNIWAGTGAPQRPAGAAGLRHYELRLRSEPAVRRTLQRLESELGISATDHPDGVLLHDPAGNALTLAPD